VRRSEAISVRRLIFVSQVFAPDEQATSQLFSDLFVLLAARGWDVEVLTGLPVGKTTKTCARVECWCGLTIRRGGLRVDSKRSLWHRFFGYFSYGAWLIGRLLFHTSPTAQIMVVTNPPFAPALVHWCACFRSWKYDVLLQDIYPEGLIALGLIRKLGLTSQVWHLWNAHAFGAARRLWVIGRDMDELCRKDYGVSGSKIVYSPNWSSINADANRKAADTELWAKLGLDGCFVVQYSGNMGLWHDIETIVQAAAELRAEPRVRILMIGDGRRRKEAEAYARNLALQNIVWLPHQPRGKLTDSLACCQAAIISQRAGLEGLAVPSKLYGILASGRAVLAQVPAQCEIARVVAEENCGIWIEPGNARALTRAIRSLAVNPRLADEMGARAFIAYRDKYTAEKAAARYDSVLRENAAPTEMAASNAPI